MSKTPVQTRVIRAGLGATVIAACAIGAGACSGETTLLYKIQRSGGGSGGAEGEGTGGRPGTGGASTGTGGSGGAELPATGGATGAGGAVAPTGSGGASGGAGAAGAGSGGVGAGSGGAGAGSGGAGAGSGGAGTGGAAGGAGGSVNTGPIQVLVWNNALVFGHASRVNSLPYFKARESTDNIRFDTTYAHTGTATDGPSDQSFDASVFTDAGLDRYDVILFLNTTGTTIDDGQKAVRRQAFQDFIVKKGRGFVGTHAATDTYQNGTWPWYVDFVGSNFKEHSNAGTSGTARYYQNMTHPILTAAMTPSPWNRAEEWYTFVRDPSSISGVRILLTCQDQSISTERPSAWIHEMPLAAGAPRAGRMFYTAMGHSTAAYMEKAFMDLLVNGIKWAAHRLN